MKKVILKSKTVNFYDDPDELPIKLYWKFVYYATMEMNLSVEHFNKFTMELDKLVASDDKNGAAKLIQNMRISLHLAAEKVDLKSLALAHLIHSIDNETPVYDDDSLTQLMEQLSDDGLTVGQVKELYTSLKKKWMLN